MKMVTFAKLFTIILIALMLATAGFILTVRAGLDPLAVWCGIVGIWIIAAAWLWKEEK